MKDCIQRKEPAERKNLKKLPEGVCLMMLRKMLLTWLLFSHWIYAEELFVTIEPIHDDQLAELFTEFPRTKVERRKSLNIRFQGRSHSEFPHIYSLPTNITYSQVLVCNDVGYPTILLNTDTSYEDGSYSYTSNTNRLYIYDTYLSLLKYDESDYSFTVSFSSGSEFLEEHRFTLDSLESFACSQVERELDPKSVEKAFATNKIYSQYSLKKGYSEYSTGKIKAMFEAYPLSKRNVTQYNNIAYYFEKNKAYEQSAFILEKVLNQYPTRTVAYINLGDAYWGLNKKDKAKISYKKYVELMKSNDKEDRIPKKVLDRI